MNTQPPNIERAIECADNLAEFLRREQGLQADYRARVMMARHDLADIHDLLNFYRRPWWSRLLYRLRALPWYRLRRWLLPAAVALLLVGCRAPGKAVATLQAAGYVAPVVTGSAVWGCADYPISDAFTARTAAGDTVRGCVCRRYWGAPVIRVKQ